MNPQLMCALGAAVGHRLARRRPVVVGRDSRASGEVLLSALLSGLRGVGCQVIDIGVVPTPTVPLMVKKLRAGAGLQISASHNPEPWNALKIYTGKGRNVDQQQLQQVLQALATPSPQQWCSWDALGSAAPCHDALAQHLKAVLGAVDVELLRRRRFKVVIDSVNGSGAVIAPLLLDALGAQVVPLYDRPDRLFPRDPEPTAANVVETGQVVRAVGADIGLVQDPDADRLAVIDERGRYIGEEYTLVLCAAARFAAVGPGQSGQGGQSSVAVTNLSTSRMLEDVAAQHGAQVIRTPVGEAHVLDAMQAHGAVIGGEGNGGVIDPRVVACRDSQVAMALILEYLARQQAPLSQVVDAIPRYAMHKEKVALDRTQVAAAIGKLQGSDLAQGATLDERDGLKLSWSDRWVHLRASGTEPAARIISEAPDASSAKALATALRQFIGAAVIAGH